RASYSSLISCQAVFVTKKKISFQLQPLALTINLSLSSAGGEFYSVSNRCQPPLLPLQLNFDQPANDAKTTTSSARRILHSFRCFATPLFKLTH
ncbi:MAG: hypothetical protein KKH53_19645, partial [Gammaproteobacteria bacterium]|nr:hypothetical protein [Gammaproteobacteria bacterium]